MTAKSFSLIPFPASDVPDITITGTISFLNSLLAIRYSVTGNLNEIILAPPASHPVRQDELWKETCFECFLAVEHQPEYWELNFAPSGDWNAYHMDAYRRIGFREEALIEQMKIESWKEDGQSGADVFCLNVSIDFSRWFPPGIPLQAGITAVIRAKDGNESYWALSHPEPRADFHLRESFILQLEGQTRLSTRSAPGG